MFKCAITHKQSKPGDKCHRLTVAFRPVQYAKIVLNEETRKKETVIYATGTEIAKEVNATEEGVKIWNASHPEGAPLMGSPVMRLDPQSMQ